MRVATLIKKLENFPKEWEVFYKDGEDLIEILWCNQGIEYYEEWDERRKPVIDKEWNKSYPYWRRVVTLS